MAQGDQTRLFELLGKPSEYTNDELAELRRASPTIRGTGEDDRAVAVFRAAVETIASIRRFDNASAQLISTTNRLTIIILVLAALQIIVGIISLFSRK